jgi:multisubunit Na+/H+ antiporter MnhB subunit
MTEKKRERLGRRFFTGVVIIALVTVAFYFSVYREADFQYFKYYSLLVTIVGLFVGGYLTVTDVIAIRNGKKEK